MHIDFRDKGLLLSAPPVEPLEPAEGSDGEDCAYTSADPQIEAMKVEIEQLCAANVGWRNAYETSTTALLTESMRLKAELAAVISGTNAHAGCAWDEIAALKAENEKLRAERDNAEKNVAILRSRRELSKDATVSGLLAQIAELRAELAAEPESAPTYTQNFHVTLPADARTQAQIAATVMRGAAAVWGRRGNYGAPESPMMTADLSDKRCAVDPADDPAHVKHAAPETSSPIPPKSPAQISKPGLLFEQGEGRYRGLGFCDGE